MGIATRNYTPLPPDASFLDAVAGRRFSELPAVPPSSLPYDRVGLDRAAAIWIDLTAHGRQPVSTIMDLGANTGYVGLCLAALGYRVTAVDNDIAGRANSSYPARVAPLARAKATASQIHSYSFIESDIEAFLARTSLIADATLLLSVAHQWWAGYAGTSIGARSLNDIRSILRRICALTRSYLYLEHPLSLEGMRQNIDGASLLALPAWFRESGLARKVEEIHRSPDAFGVMRGLYRIEVEA